MIRFSDSLSSYFLFISLKAYLLADVGGGAVWGRSAKLLRRRRVADSCEEFCVGLQWIRKF